MTRLTAFIRQLLRKSARDRKGAIALVTAFSLMAVVGFAGLGTEASYWYVKKQSMQSAADSAAFSAAAAILNGETFTTPTTGTPVNAAEAVLATYGFTGGTGGDTTISVTSPPPAPDAFSNDTNAVEVTITQTLPRLLSAFFISSDPTVSASAVATQVASSAPPCVMALDTGNVKDVSDSGSATLNMPGCNMYINSSATNALNMSGSAQITAASTYVVGGASSTAGVHDSVGTHLDTGTPEADPFASQSFSMPSGCGGGATTTSVTGTKTLQPGVYCGGITVNNGANLTLAPGTYYMNGGSGVANENAGLNVLSGATISGQGVTIVLTGSTGNYATVQISGSANVTLDTTTLGPLAGLTFFQDRNAPATPANPTPTTENNFGGGANLNIGGGIYFPKQLVTYSGGAPNNASTAAPCTELIAYQVTIGGNTNFNSNCGSLGSGSGLGGSTVVALVE